MVASRGSAEGEDTVRLITAAGGVATFMQTDVTQSTEVVALITQTVKTYGRLDCAFNNAGYEGVCPLPTFRKRTGNAPSVPTSRASGCA